MRKLTHLGHRPGPARDVRQARATPYPTPAPGGMRATHVPGPDVGPDRLSQTLTGDEQASAPPAPLISSEPGSTASKPDGSYTKLYIDIMHAAVRRSDDWGSMVLIGESLRGLGAMAIVGAPVGLPCALVADAARLGGRWWHALWRHR